MTWLVAVSLATIFGVPVGVGSIWLVIRQQNRDKAMRAAAEARTRSQDLQDKYNDGYTAGMAHMAPEVNLMRSERDDARRERDNERAERVSCQRRVEELEDQLRGNR